MGVVGLTRFALLSALLLFSPLAAARAEEEPVVPLETRVNHAIDVGVKWMRSIQAEDGTFPLGKRDDDSLGATLGKDSSEMWAGGPWDKGLHALCVYTLAACDVAPHDPVLEKAFARLRQYWDERRIRTTAVAMDRADGISTYFVSICLLAMEAAYNPSTGALAVDPRLRKKRKSPLSKKQLAWAKELVAWLQSAQDPGKGNTAPSPPSKGNRPRSKKPKAPPASRSPSAEDGGGFGYEAPAEAHTHHDLSNTQFALLGLKAAARLGVEVPDAMWIRALRHYLVTQDEDGPEVDRVTALGAGEPVLEKPRHRTDPEPVDADGKDRARGWGYMARGSQFDQDRNGPPGDIELPDVPGFPPGGVPVDPGDIMRGATLSMTAGGVSSLVICRSELTGRKGYTTALAKLTEQAIRDGLAWMATHLEPKGKDTPIPGPFARMGDDLEDFYFLYGMERACILAGVARLGPHDWYAEGAKRILDSQREDGSFLSGNRNNGNGRASIDSCFALLFLKRAIFRVPPPAARPTTTGK